MKEMQWHFNHLLLQQIVLTYFVFFFFIDRFYTTMKITIYIFTYLFLMKFHNVTIEFTCQSHFFNEIFFPIPFLEQHSGSVWQFQINFNDEIKRDEIS